MISFGKNTETIVQTLAHELPGNSYYTYTGVKTFIESDQSYNERIDRILIVPDFFRNVQVELQELYNYIANASSATEIVVFLVRQRQKDMSFIDYFNNIFIGQNYAIYCSDGNLAKETLVSFASNTTLTELRNRFAEFIIENPMNQNQNMDNMNNGNPQMYPNQVPNSNMNMGNVGVMPMDMQNPISPSQWNSEIPQGNPQPMYNNAPMPPMQEQDEQILPMEMQTNRKVVIFIGDYASDWHYNAATLALTANCNKVLMVDLDDEYNYLLGAIGTEKFFNQGQEKGITRLQAFEEDRKVSVMSNGYGYKVTNSDVDNLVNQVVLNSYANEDIYDLYIFVCPLHRMNLLSTKLVESSDVRFIVRGVRESLFAFAHDLTNRNIVSGQLEDMLFRNGRVFIVTDNVTNPEIFEEDKALMHKYVYFPRNDWYSKFEYVHKG
jgi:hypothetical protein